MRTIKVVLVYVSLMSHEIKNDRVNNESISASPIHHNTNFEGSVPSLEKEDKCLQLKHQPTKNTVNNASRHQKFFSSRHVGWWSKRAENMDWVTSCLGSVQIGSFTLTTTHFDQLCVFGTCLNLSSTISPFNSATG